MACNWTKKSLDLAPAETDAMVLDFSVQRTILPIPWWDLMVLVLPLALGFSSFGGIVYRRTLLTWLVWWAY